MFFCRFNPGLRGEAPLALGYVISPRWGDNDF
jgi:hypothetical protein